VQSSPAGRPPVGVKVKAVLGEALSEKVRLPALVQTIVNELPEAATLSLKLTVMAALSATLVALLTGTVVVTDGGKSVVKVKLKSAAILSGGSPVSVSLI